VPGPPRALCATVVHFEVTVGSTKTAMLFGDARGSTRQTAR
jgi:hypothetical protein